MPSPGVRMPTMRSPGTAPPLGAKRTGRSLLMPRIGIAARSLPPARLNFDALRALEAEPAAVRLRRCAARRRARPCSRDTSRARHRTAPSRRGRPPTSPRRARRARGAAARPAASRRNRRSWRAGTAARRCGGRARHIALRTATRVARRIAARALPVATSNSQTAGGALCAFDMMISTSSPF